MILREIGYDISGLNATLTTVAKPHELLIENTAEEEVPVLGKLEKNTHFFHALFGA